MELFTVTHVFALINDTDLIVDVLGKMLICDKYYVLEVMNPWLVMKTMDYNPI